MKEYTVIDIMRTTTDSTETYYSRADLIAAGCLVPVPDGEAVALENLEESALFMNYAALMKFARFHPSNFCKCIYVDSGNHTTLPWLTIVQPVRLVRLEDVG